MKFSLSIFTLFVASTAMAANKFPPAPQRGAPPPPGVPIDMYLYGLLAIGILIMIIFKDKIKLYKNKKSTF